MTSFAECRLKWSGPAADVDIEMLRPASVGIATGSCVSNSMRLPKAARCLLLFLFLSLSPALIHSSLSLSISRFLFSIVWIMVDDHLTTKHRKQNCYWQLFGWKLFITFEFPSIQIKQSNKTAIKALAL